MATRASRRASLATARSSGRCGGDITCDHNERLALGAREAESVGLGIRCSKPADTVAVVDPLDKGDAALCSYLCLMRPPLSATTVEPLCTYPSFHLYISRTYWISRLVTGLTKFVHLPMEGFKINDRCRSTSCLSSTYALLCNCTSLLHIAFDSTAPWVYPTLGVTNS